MNELEMKITKERYGNRKMPKHRGRWRREFEELNKITASLRRSRRLQYLNVGPLSTYVNNYQKFLMMVLEYRPEIVKYPFENIKGFYKCHSYNTVLSERKFDLAQGSKSLFNSIKIKSE